VRGGSRRARLDRDASSAPLPQTPHEDDV
jgi:hypothetical protein